jgi:hypothetical protein
LQELVVVVELVVLFFHGLDAVEDLEERELEGLGVSVAIPLAVDTAQLSTNRSGETYSFNCALASSDIFSRSCELRLGLMARASSSSKISEPSGSSTCGCSRGTMMVPLDLRDTRRGRGRWVVMGASSRTEDAEEDMERLCEVRGGGIEESMVGKGMVGGGDAICVYVVVWWLEKVR